MKSFKSLGVCDELIQALQKTRYQGAYANSRTIYSYRL